MNISTKTQLPLLELDLLKTLVAIAERGNFSSAAEVVFRTPSAISVQVKKIEELVERPIFIRDSRSVSLTQDALLLLEHARRVLALNNEMVARFVTPNMEGEVRLGAVDHVAEQFLTTVLRRFSETHPGVVVEVTVENSAELAERMKTNQLDMALVTCNSANYAGLDLEVIFREKLVWAGLKGGICVEQTPLPISVWEEGCVWRQAALDGLEKSNRDYHVNFKSAYVSGQKAAILADLAIALLPASSCDGNIVSIDSKYNLPALSEYSIGMIMAQDTSCSVDAIADHLRASFAFEQAA